MTTMNHCYTCGPVAGPVTVFDIPDGPARLGLIAIGQPVRRSFCGSCCTCSICGKAITPDNGTPRVRSFPPVHAACLRGRLRAGDA